MRKQYTVLLTILAIEFVVLKILQKLEVQFQTWIANAVGAVVFASPIVALMFCVSKDENMSPRVREVCKVGAWFVIFCTVAGGIATLTE